MRNRSGPAKDAAGSRRSGKGAHGPTIWVAAGASPLVSAGVEIVPLEVTIRPPSPEYLEEQRRKKEARREARRRAEAEAAPVGGAAGVAPVKPIPVRADRTPEEERIRNGRQSTGAKEPRRTRADWAAGPDGERRSQAPVIPIRRKAGSEGLPIAHPAPPKGGWTVPEFWDLPLGPDGLELGDAETTYVPPAVDAAAETVMSLYSMRVSGRTLITTKPDKGGAIWRIETDRGPRSLKMLHRPAARSLFSVGAQDYLVKQGARVPALVPARGGELAVEIAGKLWIVTDWVEPLTPATKVDLEGISQLCYGLGEFHRHSRGYVPPKGARHSSRLYRWPKTYEKILTKIGWFRNLARLYPEMPASPTLLSVVDMFEEQARDAIARLEASPYSALVARGEQAWGLAHQDYGFSNGQLGPGGVWIIDLDGVAFDLAIRDLRKLITSTMDDMGVWDLTWIRGMIDAYHAACPIEPELMQVLLVDMSLPNEFYKHVKEIVTDPATAMGEELNLLLQRLLQVEDSKWAALRELGLRPAGAKGVKTR